MDLEFLIGMSVCCMYIVFELFFQSMMLLTCFGYAAVNYEFKYNKLKTMIFYEVILLYALVSFSFSTSCKM